MSETSTLPDRISGRYYIFLAEYADDTHTNKLLPAQSNIVETPNLTPQTSHLSPVVPIP